MSHSIRRALRERWELEVVHLLSEVENYLRQKTCGTGPLEDQLRDAFLAGASKGYWDGVRDAVTASNTKSQGEPPERFLADA